jgi:hypothetical protein
VERRGGEEKKASHFACSANVGSYPNYAVRIANFLPYRSLIRCNISIFLIGARMDADTRNREHYIEINSLQIS